MYWRIFIIWDVSCTSTGKFRMGSREFLIFGMTYGTKTSGNGTKLLGIVQKQ